MIILKKLSWSNCFSYGDNNSIDLNEESLLQLVGVNGVGKSSIPLILEEVLYNKNSKGAMKADIPNRLSNGSYNIELQMQVDEDEYLVKLTRKSSLQITLIKNGEDISSHTATNTFKTIESIIGLDYKTFSQLIYQNPNSSLQFLTATDTTRKRFLIELLGLDKYLDYFEEFKALTKSYNTKLVSISASVESYANLIKENTLDSYDVKPIQEVSIDTSEDEVLLEKQKTKLSNIVAINKKIAKNNNYKAKLESIDTAAITAEPQKPIDTGLLTEELGAIKSAKTKYEQHLVKLNSLKGSCPTCFQAIDTSKSAEMILETKDQIKELTGRLDKVLNNISEIKAINKSIEEANQAKADFNSIYKSIDNSLPSDPLIPGDLEIKIKDLEAELKAKKASIKAIIDSNIQAEKHNTRVQIVKDQLQDLTVKLEESKANLASVTQVYSKLELLKKVFSTNGLLAYKIENLVKDLESIVNEYLLELSDGRFSLEFIVTNDKLDVVIMDNGNTTKIQSLSSGELARVTTASLLAIRKLMNQLSKSRINILFLDEVIGVLDELGKERLVEILLKEGMLNTFIVSHQWTHPLLAKIIIIKEDGISKIIAD